MPLMTGTVDQAASSFTVSFELGADHDRGVVLRQRAGRVGDALAARQVDLAGAQVQGVAAELGEAVLEAHARARGSGLEDHGQVLPRQERRERPLLPQRLEVDGQREQVLELLAACSRGRSGSDDRGACAMPGEWLSMACSSSTIRTILAGWVGGSHWPRGAPSGSAIRDGHCCLSVRTDKCMITSTRFTDNPATGGAWRQKTAGARVSPAARACPSPCLLEDPMAALPPTAQRLLAAARRLLVRGGFDALTLSAIAEEAGEAKASIGYHFGNKDGLVTALVDSLAHDANRALIKETSALPARRGPRARPDGRRVAHRRRRRVVPGVLRDAARTRCATRRCAIASPPSTTATARRCCAASTTPTRRGAAELRPFAVLMIAIVDGLAIQHGLDPEGPT